MRRHNFGLRGGSVGGGVFRNRLVGRGEVRSGSMIFAAMATVAILLFTAPAFGQADWYVDGVGGNDSNNGQTWATAFATIQKAVTSTAQFGGYEIWVAKGTYVLSETISIPWLGSKVPFRIYGGFESGASSLSERDWAENLTVIDGNGVAKGVIAITVWVDLIDGFTITGGSGEPLGTGGAIDIRGCGNAAPQPVLRNLVIRGNGGDTTHPPAYYEGGGIYIEDCSPWIVNVSFSNNRVWGHGGAVFARDSDGTPIDTYPTIVNSTFTGNHSDINGGAVGVYGGSLNIANSILWGDSAGDGVTHEVFGATLNISSSDVGQPGYAGVYGNINQDPKMTGVGRFHLRDGSPCIDSGDDTKVPAWLLTDFDGDDRFVDGVTGTAGGTVDMGADEYVPGSFAGVYYVDGASGNDMNSGTSWGSAFKTIQGAVPVAVSDAEIWVKQGTYALTSSVALAPINSNLAFYGGFAGTETLRSQRSTDASLTIVDGQNAHSCFSLAGLLASHINDVVIDGFTLTRGNHAVTIVYADGTVINNCRMTDATVDGAIYVGWADLSVSNCLFSGNRATERAGAIHMVAGTDRLTVTDSTFIGNAAEGLSFSTSGCGGAIRAGTGTIERSRFLGNMAARHGGAIYNYSDFGEGLVIRNCELSGNQAGLGISSGTAGGTWGPVEIVNSSIAGNTAPEWQIGGVSNATAITNSILWRNDSVANTRNTNIHCLNGKVFFSDVGDDSYAVVATCQIPYGNINADPLFVDADGIDNTAGTTDDDLTLQSGSPAIDAGDSTALELGSLDLAANPRHIDDPGVVDSGYGPEPAIDIGAHERQASTPALTYDLTMAVSGNGSSSPAVGPHTYDNGSVVTVSAVADLGWQFTGWTGWVADPASESTNITMTWDRTVIANFKQVQTLIVDIQGSSSGAVTSAPLGISCPGDCDEVYDYGTAVTLSTTVDSGTVFDGWTGGGCLGTDDCQLAMDEDLIVVAMCNLEGGCGIGDNVILDNMVVDWVQSFEGCTSITLGSGFRVESPGDVIFRAADRVVLENGFSVGVGAYFEVQITGDVALRKVEVSKTASPTSAPEGDPITYTISVENTGNADLTEVSAADDKCTASPVYQSGDDGDTVLEPGEIWVYQCGGLAEAKSFVNTATMTFEDIFGQDVSDTGEAAVKVEIPACAGNRYADMGDGTILDCNTDLLWLQDSSCSPDFGATYADVLTAVSSLAHGTCGLSDGSAPGDWRLPTMNELCAGWISPNTGEVCWEASYGIPNMGLINNDCLCPAVSHTDGTCDTVCGYPSGDPFIGLGSGTVWSSIEKDVSNIWSVSLYEGSASGYPKTATAWAWPVRAW